MQQKEVVVAGLNDMVRRILAFKPIVARKRLMKGGKLPKGWIPFHRRRDGRGEKRAGWDGQVNFRNPPQHIRDYYGIQKGPISWRTIVGRD